MDIPEDVYELARMGGVDAFPTVTGSRGTGEVPCCAGGVEYGGGLSPAVRMARSPTERRMRGSGRGDGKRLAARSTAAEAGRGGVIYRGKFRPPVRLCESREIQPEQEHWHRQSGARPKSG
jgi:hypothetical protein